LGAESRAAGAFLLIRRLLIDAGAPADQITPSTPFGPLMDGRDSVFWKLCCVAPGRVPRPARGPSINALPRFLVLSAIATAVAGILLRSHALHFASLIDFVAAFVVACVLRINSKPQEMRL